jgi:hypothetical protein
VERVGRASLALRLKVEPPVRREAVSGDDYIPIDLGALCNARAASITSMTAPMGAPSASTVPAPVGRRSYRGLPFFVGREGGGDAPDLVLLGGDASGSVVVPVGASATWLLFLHRLLDTEVYTGANVGAVADYVVRFADGSAETVPIRERFEIGFSDERWTQIPFLAWWADEYGLPPRLGGNWDDAGIRQTESDFPGTPSWSIFPWRNPRPSAPIESVEIVPRGPRFALGAITRSTLDEHPIRSDGPRDVVVTVADAAEVGPVFGASGGRVTEATAVADLRIEVDRGMAGYPFALPAGGAAAFLDDPVRGFGEAANSRPSPAVARIQAVESATIRVGLGDRELGSARWGDIVRDGSAEPSPGVRIEAVDPGRNWVRTTVVDDATGDIIPCRVHFRSPQGIPFAPHGHHAYVNSNNGSWHADVGGDVRLGQITYAYIDGTCEGWLPRGEVLVDVAQGFEYEPLRTRVTIEPGQQDLQLRLRRVANLNAEGWWAGDTHVHFLSPSGGVTEARGEGVNVVNVLQAQWGSLFTNTEDFTGRPYVSQDGRTIVYTAQENRQHVAGHMSLLGLKRPVMPWSSDGLGEAELAGTMDTTMSDWADRTHAQGGTVVTPHFPSPNGETATLIATGRTDAIEMIRHGRYEHGTWYRYLNAGYRLPLVGGTDKMSSDTPLGIYRTYVRLGADEPLTYDAWLAGLRAGRTIHSGGPIVRLTVDGAEVGDTVALPAGGGTVTVEARVDSIFPIHTLEIIQDGGVIDAVNASEASGTRTLRLSLTLPVARHSWIAARAGGRGYWDTIKHYDSWQRPIFGHTSPVYVSVGGDWWRHDDATAVYMLTLIDGELGYIRGVSAQAVAGSRTFHHGQADHLAFLEQPHHEAIAAIETRRRRAGVSR